MAAKSSFGRAIAVGISALLLFAGAMPSRVTANPTESPMPSAALTPIPATTGPHYTVTAAPGTAAPSTSAPAQNGPGLHMRNGRLLDMQNGFAFFSNGDTYRIAPDAIVRSLDTGKPFTGDDVAGLYAEVGFSAKGVIEKLEITRKSLALDDFDTVHSYAVSLSTPYSNPDLNSGGEGYTGEPVLVSFTVSVPPNTPLSESIYISTEASQWDPMEIRMDRIDALHYRITKRISSGTHVTYRYTRGSWRAAERGRTGLEGAPREFTVKNLDLERRDDTVYHWSDESADGSTAITPDSIPTPFSNNPFGATPNPLHF